MPFGYVILYVDDVEATLNFYERAFGLTRRMLDDEKNYGELERGDTRLAFAANQLVPNLFPLKFAECGANRAAPPFESGMVAENVESSYGQALASGAIE